MIRKERMLAAIKRWPVDRYPYATYNIHPYTDNPHTRDSSYAEILRLIEASAGVAAKWGAGGEGPAMSKAAPGVVESSNETDSEDTITTNVWHTPKGDLISASRASAGQPPRQIKHLIETDDDIEKYMSLPYDPPEYDVSGARFLCDAVGDRGLLFMYIGAPIENIVPLFHFEDFCVRALTDFPTIKRMLDWAFERCVQNARLLVKACAGIDCIFHLIGPEYVTPPMIPPRLFPEFITPYVKPLVEIVHGAGFPVCVHCHGRVRDAVPELIKAGIDLLEPIEPIPQGDIDLAELLDTFGRDISFMGHIQDQDIYTAPPGYFTKWVEGIAKTVNGRTGYIMSPTCTPFDIPCTETYRRNYIEWLEAAEQYLQ